MDDKNKTTRMESSEDLYDNESFDTGDCGNFMDYGN